GNDTTKFGSAAIPDASQFNLHLSHPTQFEAFSIHAGADQQIAADPALEALLGTPIQQAAQQNADLTSFFGLNATRNRNVQLQGPLGVGTSKFVPQDTPLPYSVTFANPATATTNVNQVKIA